MNASKQAQKTLIIDGQLLQTKAWSRGMGRYMLSLLSGVYANDNPPKVIILLSNNFEFEEEKQETLAKVAPDAELHFLDFPKGLSGIVEKRNQAIFDRFVLDNGLEGSIFLMASIFSFDYQPAYPTTTVNVCIAYDLIPLKAWEVFHNYFPDREYFSRFKFLYDADKILSISDAVKSDLIEYLGFEDRDIVNIDGAEIPNFLSGGQRTTHKESPRPYKYILLPGGDSPHKNMLRAIRGFDLFNAKFGDTYKLVITSFYSPNNIKRMQALSPNIELAGQVSDDELHNLYAHAELVVFASLDEGLGLPVLEAVGYGKKVACSSIPVFKEISKDAFHFFDPFDVDAIARAITDAAMSPIDSKKNVYKKIKDKFTWKRSARVMLDTLPTVEATNKEKSGSRTIIVEQTGDLDTLKTLSPLIKRYYKQSRIMLSIDTGFEDTRNANQLPLIFNYFLRFSDIVDAPKKSKRSDRTVIYTKRSGYSYALASPGDEILFANTTQAEVATRFTDEFGEGNKELKAKVMEELKND